MQYKVKWRVAGDGPLAPEVFASEAEAKARARQLLGEHGARVTIDVWNGEETWQIVSPAGVAEWCKQG